jgi:hypothetical protein
MAAPLGFKDFTTGEVLTAGDVDGYLMQGIWVFASAAARDAAVTSPQEGNACYLKDTDVIMVYTGSAWATQSASNPISANIVDAKGDLIAGTAADTVARLAVGTNDQVLVADSTAATGLKWATPASGGGMTLLSTTSLSGTSTQVSSISGSYKELVIYVRDWYASSDFNFTFTVNNDTTSGNYQILGFGSRNGNNTAYYGENASRISIDSYGTSKSGNNDYFAEIRIPDYANAVTRKTIHTTAAYLDTTASLKTIANSTTHYTSTTTITSLEFRCTVGTWSSGSVLIYGVN